MDMIRPLCCGRVLWQDTDFSLDLDSGRAEIDEKTYVDLRRGKVVDELHLVCFDKPVDRFQLDQYRAFHQDIAAKLTDTIFFKPNVNRHLLGGCQSTFA